jgi:hypothetical protein
MEHVERRDRRRRTIGRNENPSPFVERERSFAKPHREGAVSAGLEADDRRG